MRVTFRTLAPDGTCFGAESFADLIGRQVPVSGLGLPSPAIGTLVAVQVTEDHTAADITVELSDEVPGLQLTVGLQAER